VKQRGPTNCKFRHECWHGDLCEYRSTGYEVKGECFHPNGKAPQEKREQLAIVQEVPTNAAEYREGELF